jgi:hypothetical protein
VTTDEQLAWERRAGPTAGLAAIGAAVLIVGGGIYTQVALGGPDNAAEALDSIDRHTGELLAGRAVQALGLLLLIPVLRYLYAVARFRRPETPKVALVLAVAGPLGVATVGVLRQVVLVGVAGDFTSGEPVGKNLVDRAEDQISDSSLPAVEGVNFGVGLGLGFAVVLLSLNAMRAGLTSRFLGVIGIIVGVLYVLPVAGGPQIVQLFWLGALGALFLDRWPGGRGPAWSSGEAEPWPTQAEVRERAGDGAGDGAPAAAPAAADPDVPRKEPRPASRKRRRKKRR